MLFLKNYSKSLGISVLILLVLTFIVTLLNYIGLFGLSMVNIFSYITPFLSLFIGSFILGKKSNNKGWLEGLKFGLIMNIIFLLFNYLAFESGFSLSNIILYIIVLIASILGSMIGISLKKES